MENGSQQKADSTIVDLDSKIAETNSHLKQLEGQVFLFQLFMAGLIAAKNAVLRKIMLAGCEESRDEDLS